MDRGGNTDDLDGQVGPGTTGPFADGRGHRLGVARDRDGAEPFGQGQPSGVEVDADHAVAAIGTQGLDDKHPHHPRPHHDRGFARRYAHPAHGVHRDRKRLQ